MGLRVFVTRELFPFTAGGIGRVVANILATSSKDDLERTAILYVGNNVDDGAFSTIYPSVRFMPLSGEDYRLVDDEGRRYPPSEAFTDTALHWESVLILQGLRALRERHGELSYVEFVDWGGTAFAATQEKLLGNDFGDTVLAVRLHTTDSILADFEPRTPDIHGLCLHDLERKALADCDLIVAQLGPVSEAFRTFYGFSNEEWRGRVCVHAPPVLLDTLKVADASIIIDENTPLVFSSKLQDIKRPDVFVRGCAQFMLANPAYKGKAVFLAHAFDAHYQESIRGLIPEVLQGRFVFARGLAGAAREKTIAASICIFPSPWESFCLAAYEASLSGAICVLNSRNPAFGDETPWLDQENCIKFDGIPSSLASALGRLYSSGSERRPVKVPTDDLPWDARRAPISTRTQIAENRMARLSVVLVNQEEGGRLGASIDSILSSDYPIHELIVVDDASADVLSGQVLEVLQTQLGGDVKVVRLAARSGAGAAYNAGLDVASGELVAFLQSGELVETGYFKRAARGLARNPDFDLVVGQLGISSAVPLSSDPNARYERCMVYTGDARTTWLSANHHGPDAFVIRNSVARATRFDETLPALNAWEFLARLCLAGRRSIVSSSIEVSAAPSRPMLATVARGQATALQVARRRFAHGKRAAFGSIAVPAYVVGAHTGAIAATPADDDAQQRLQELMQSETVRVALAVSRRLQAHAPWILSLCKRPLSWVMRLRQR